MSIVRREFWTIAGVVAGFLLSFAALGMLWVGTPWAYQFLMFVPFFLIAAVLRRFGGTAYPVLVGIVPISTLFVQFRDASNSHLYPVLIVGTWCIAILLGQHVSARWLARRSK